MLMTLQSRPILFNISGPYAVGKDTVLNSLLARYPVETHRVRTITTRAVSEDSDPSYESLSQDQFDKRVSNGRWIVNRQLSAQVSYGTSIDEIEAEAQAGRICVHSIFAGPDGAGALRRTFGRALISLGLLATQGDISRQLNVLRDRLLLRGRDDIATVELRLKHQLPPLEYVMQNPSVAVGPIELPVFDYVITNENLPDTVKRANEIFAAEFCRGEV